MIQKIISSSFTSPLKRSTLRTGKNKLKNLAGSSMSNWNFPEIKTIEMIIPNGLKLKEKMFFLLKGYYPKSVLDRWIPNDGNNPVHANDTIVTTRAAINTMHDDSFFTHNDIIENDGNSNPNLVDDIHTDNDNIIDIDDTSL